MQTIFFETSSFIRHEGNVVDLGAYRQKLAAVSGGGWESESAQPVPIQEEIETEIPCAPVPLRLLEREEAVVARPRSRKRRRIRKLALALDLCATLAVVGLTVTAILYFIAG